MPGPEHRVPAHRETHHVLRSPGDGSLEVAGANRVGIQGWEFEDPSMGSGECGAAGRVDANPVDVAERVTAPGRR